MLLKKTWSGNCHEQSRHNGSKMGEFVQVA
jgi:hypothetical protein